MLELASLFSSSIFFSAVAAILSGARTPEDPAVLPPLALFAAGMAGYWVDRLLLRKARSANLLLAVNLALFALGLAAVIWLGHCTGVICAGFFAIATACLVYAGYGLCRTAPTQTNLVGRLEASAAVLVILLLLQNSVVPETLSPLYPAVSAALCVGASIWRRLSATNRGNGRGAGAILVTGTACAVVAAAAGFVAVFAAPLGTGLYRAVTAVVHGVRWLGRTVGQGLLWLLSKLPASDAAPSDIAAADPIHTTDNTVELGEIAFDRRIFIVLLVLAALALLLLIVHLLRRTKIARRSAPAVQSGRVTEKTRLGATLKQAFAQLRRALLLRWKILLHRGTVLGAYLGIERTLRRTPLARRCGETPRQFLTRCAAAAPTQSDAFAALADRLDAACYSAAGGAGTPLPEAKALRRTARHLAENPSFSDK